MTQRASNQENSLLTSNEQTLSERLRDCVKVTFSAGLHGVESDCRQAAEELDRQRAEIERLREVLERWTQDGRLQTFEDRERFRAEVRKVLSVEGASAHETTADVREMNRQLCESEGHVFSRIAAHRCFRCGTEVLPGAYTESTHKSSAEYEALELHRAGTELYELACQDLAALDQHAGHSPTCISGPTRCDCGYTQLRLTLRDRWRGWPDRHAENGLGKP